MSPQQLVEEVATDREPDGTPRPFGWSASPVFADGGDRHSTMAAPLDLPHIPPSNPNVISTSTSGVAEDETVLMGLERGL
jgi:hypothetical protein